jgi:DNA (cytosine-5)-methyltransferase 1
MRHGSLFSGIGGFDLAAEWMGWENVFHCEWMDFPRKVLDYYWPNADSHIDICKTDFTKYANTIDILTGGFPCQPFSLAGKRKGTNDERYLWHEMLRAIQEIKPKFVIAENVFGITNIDGGLVFEQVCLDLEAEGYEVQPFIIAAASKNAPHRRDRCWFIGVRNATDTLQIRLQQCEDGTEVGGGQEEICRQRSESSDGIEANGKIRNATDTHSRGLERSIEVGWNGNNVIGQSEFGNATDTLHKGLQRGQKIDRWEKHNAERRRNGVDIGTDGKNIGGQIRREFQEFPTQSPICGGDDGLPTKLDGITFSKWRKESIKAYGNAIVPQVAYELFKQLI